MQIIVNKLLTTYTEVGSGTKNILFLHGWADSGKTFEMLAREIIAVDANYRAVLLDLPGFGGTAAPETAWTLSDYAAFVADFLAKAQIQPLAIVGHSNGGAIAINGLAHNVLTTP